MRSSDRHGHGADDLAHEAVLDIQEHQRLLARDPFLIHDDGELHAPLGVVDRGPCRRPVRPADLHEDPLGAIDQLAVGGHQVDHQIPVRLPHANHRAGGDRVQHEFGGGTSLHAGGAGQDLGSRLHVNEDVDGSPDLLHRRCTADQRGGASDAARELERAYVPSFSN